MKKKKKKKEKVDIENKNEFGKVYYQIYMTNI